MPTNTSCFCDLWGNVRGWHCKTPDVMPHYQVETHDLEETSYRYLILFVVCFILLFGLRSSRLLADTLAFDAVINSFFLIALVTVGVITFWRRKVQRHVPNQLLWLTLINGAVGNYCFCLVHYIRPRVLWGAGSLFLFLLTICARNLISAKGDDNVED